MLAGKIVALLTALRHRLLLNFEGEAEGVTGGALVAKLPCSIPARA